MAISQLLFPRPLFLSGVGVCVLSSLGLTLALALHPLPSCQCQLENPTVELGVVYEIGVKAQPDL